MHVTSALLATITKTLYGELDKSGIPYLGKESGARETQSYLYLSIAVSDTLCVCVLCMYACKSVCEKWICMLHSSLCICTTFLYVFIFFSVVTWAWRYHFFFFISCSSSMLYALLLYVVHFSLSYALFTIFLTSVPSRFGLLNSIHTIQLSIRCEEYSLANACLFFVNILQCDTFSYMMVCAAELCACKAQ